MEGIFITFEGPDGSGKTTQLKLLADYLTDQGYEVITTREPGGTVISDQIREILLNPSHKELKDQTEILLYAASRSQLVHEIIIPAVAAGRIVLCDRYIDASIAYQAYGLGINRNIVEEINQFASSYLQPGRTYLLYVSPEIGMKRLVSRNNGLDRIEQKELEYHQRVSDGFLQLADDYPERIMKIDGNQPVEKVFEMIKDDLKKLIRKGD